MIFRILFFVALFFKLQGNNDPFLLLTVPKSGTHLVHNLIFELTGKNTRFIQNPYKLDDLSQNDNYFHSHFKYNFIPEVFKKEHPDCKYFINLRDPRDVCVSTVKYCVEVLDYLTGRNSDFDSRLSYTINYKSLNNFFGVLVHYTRALSLINNSNTLVIRFEDLVGPQGGGTYEKQISAIHQVAQFFNQQISDQDALEIGEKIFGHSNTFRSGQIGSWKQYFKPIHIQQFKKSKLQKVLVELGYEKDDQW